MSYFDKLLIIKILYKKNILFVVHKLINFIFFSAILADNIIVAILYYLI